METKTIAKTGKNFCISVDGSTYSDYAFDLIFEELYQKGDKILLVHISNPEKLKDIPFENQPKSIESKFEAKLTGKLLKEDFKIVITGKIENKAHALEQTNELAMDAKSQILVVGYRGHKGVKTGKELAKGIQYLVKKVKIPTFIIKEQSSRKNKENKAFTWLVCIEESNKRSFHAFEFALNFMNKEVDRILGINIVDGAKDTEIENQFSSICSEFGIAHSKFEYIKKDNETTIPKQICDIVNFGNDFVDFVVVGHNPGKSQNMEELNLHYITTTANANILFFS